MSINLILVLIDALKSIFLTKFGHASASTKIFDEILLMVCFSCYWFSL